MNTDKIDFILQQSRTNKFIINLCNTVKARNFATDKELAQIEKFYEVYKNKLFKELNIII